MWEGRDVHSMIIFWSRQKRFTGVRLAGIRAEATNRIEFYLAKAATQTGYSYKVIVLVIGK